jgi:hypothetical protein
MSCARDYFAQNVASDVNCNFYLGCISEFALVDDQRDYVSAIVYYQTAIDNSKHCDITYRSKSKSAINRIKKLGVGQGLTAQNCFDIAKKYRLGSPNKMNKHLAETREWLLHAIELDADFCAAYSLLASLYGGKEHSASVTVTVNHLFAIQLHQQAVDANNNNNIYCHESQIALDNYFTNATRILNNKDDYKAIGRLYASGKKPLQIGRDFVCNNRISNQWFDYVYILTKSEIGNGIDIQTSASVATVTSANVVPNGGISKHKNKNEIKKQNLRTNEFSAAELEILGGSFEFGRQHKNKKFCDCDFMLSTIISDNW